MKIQKITYSNPNIQPSKINNYKTDINKHFKSDIVSFKGYSSVAIGFVIREGYKALKTDLAKANFKNEIGQILAEPKSPYNANKLIDALFALAKTLGKDEPKNVGYEMKDKYNLKFSIEDFRQISLRKLFPLIPIMQNDKNYGSAAKMALMSSLIDSGEYLYSPYVYHAFKGIFNNSDKDSLIIKAMRDRNVWKAINEKYAIPKAHELAESSYIYKDPKKDSGSMNFFQFLKTIFYDVPNDLRKMSKFVKTEEKKLLPKIQQDIEEDKAIINTSLILTLNPNEHIELFTNYHDVIKNQSSLAFRKIAKNLKQDRNGNLKKDKLYSQYANGFNYSSIPEEVLSIAYLKDLALHFKNDKESLMAEFNIGEKYCKDIMKDFELISVSQKQELLDEKLKDLYIKRIKEKLSDSDKNIRKSASTLVYLSGHASELKNKLPNDTISDLNIILSRDNAVYGCHDKKVPTLQELEIEAEKTWKN